MEKVSVIIPAFNHAAFLDDAIKSVLESDYKIHEIIIIDDGSTDNTKNVASKYTEVDYYYKDNGGAHSAINAGIRISTGDFIAVLNDDDTYGKNHVSAAISNLNTYGNRLFIGSPSIFGEGRKLHQLTKQIEWSGQDIEKWGLIISLFKNNWALSTSAFVFEKELFNEINSFQDFILCHDLDFLLRSIFEAGISVGTSKMPTWFYRCHFNNSVSYIKFEDQIAEILYVIGRIYYKFNSDCVLLDFVKLVGYGIDPKYLSELLEIKPWILKNNQTISESINEWKKIFNEFYTHF